MLKKTHQNTPWLNIGAYCLDASVPPAQAEDIKKCGMDFVITPATAKDALDALYKNGLGAVVCGVCPEHFGGDGSNAGQPDKTHPISAYLCVKADHPAVWGVNVADEQSSLDFPHLGSIVSHLADNGISPYLNLYPSYGLKSGQSAEEVERQLGCTSYKEYIARYVRDVPTRYISFDFYLYSSDLSHAYTTFSAVADACRASSRAMHAVLQVNSHLPETSLNEAQLSFQAYLALAFGARSISWACYSNDWWYNNVLDPSGAPTEQYQRLARVNAALHALGKHLLRYRSIATHLVPASDPRGFNDSTLKGLRHTSSDILVSQMQDGSRNTAYFILSCGSDEGYLSFDCGASLTILKGEQRLPLNNSSKIPLKHGEYLLLEVIPNK